ncbi:unnamed protein product, partial [Laminaria digitata]
LHKPLSQKRLPRCELNNNVLLSLVRHKGCAFAVAFLVTTVSHRRASSLRLLTGRGDEFSQPTNTQQTDALLYACRPLPARPCYPFSPRAPSSPMYGSTRRYGMPYTRST